MQRHVTWYTPITSFTFFDTWRSALMNTTPSLRIPCDPEWCWRILFHHRAWYIRFLRWPTTFPKHVTMEYHMELPLYNFFMHTGHSSSKYAISKKQSWQEPSKTIVDRSPPPYRLPLFACALFVTLVMAFTSLRSLSPSIFDTVARMDNFHPS